MRNRYSKEFENYIKENASKCTKEQLIQSAKEKFNIQLSIDALRRYINRHKINKYIDYKEYNVRDVYKAPIGTEQITNEGVFIKIAQPDIWRRKSRVMYEQYHNCKLDEDDYIIFLNQNNNDFSKDNLVKSNRQEIAYLHNKDMFSKKKELTQLGILTAKLMIKVKESI